MNISDSNKHLGKKNLFYRFQNTLDIEKESYFIDIEFAFEDFDEYRNTFDNEEDLYFYILSKYHKSFSLRKNISPINLLDLIKNSIEADIDKLTEKYKIPYIFGYRKEDIDSDYSIQDILDESRRPMFWHCENDTYLTIYEGEEILDEHESGVLFKPSKIIKHYNVKEINNVMDKGL